MGTKSTPNTPVAVRLCLLGSHSKIPSGRMELETELVFVSLEKEFQLIYFLNDRSEWPALF